MNGPLAVSLVAVLLGVTGFGVLAVLEVAGSGRELRRHAAIAPLAGMAWVGVLGAILATVELRMTVAGMIGVGVATVAAGAVRLRRGAPPGSPATVRATRLDLGLIAAALGIVAVDVAAALALFRVKPLFEYDGWAIWGMKSRALAALGATTDVFASPGYERLHLEYPLLVPSLHSLPLQLTSHFASNTVVLSCLAIGAAGVLAIWGVLRDRVRPVLLLTFLAAIVTMPAFFDQLATGYADIPLAVFVAAGAVSAGRWLADDERSWVVLATLFFAAGSLAKNEGLLFAGAAYLALAAAARGRRRTVAVSALVVGLAYAPWKAYTAAHGLSAPDYDLSKSFDVPWVAGRLDRAPVAASGLLHRLFDRPEVGFVFILAVAVVVFTLLVGPRSLGLFAAGFAVLSFAGLTWIYVLTPYDVAAYQSTNADRVVMSLVVGLAALAPLLVEESARMLESGTAAPEAVGTPR